MYTRYNHMCGWLALKIQREAKDTKKIYMSRDNLIVWNFLM